MDGAVDNEARLSWAEEAPRPWRHVKVTALEKCGLIRREPGKPRSIELLVAPEELPILR